MYKVIYFDISVTSPAEIEAFLEQKYKEGFVLVAIDSGFFIFRELAQTQR